MPLSARLTYAELDYLLAKHPEWPNRRAALGFPEFSEADATTAAGLASLLVRDLAITGAGGVSTDERVRVLSAALVEARRFVYLDWADGESLSVGMMSVDEYPLLISLLAPGCLELVALDRAKPPEDLLFGVVNALAREDKVLGVAAPAHPPILIGRLGKEWLLGGDPDRGDPAVVDEDAVRAAVGQITAQARERVGAEG